MELLQSTKDFLTATFGTCEFEGLRKIFTEWAKADPNLPLSSAKIFEENNLKDVAATFRELEGKPVSEFVDLMSRAIIEIDKLDRENEKLKREIEELAPVESTSGSISCEPHLGTHLS